MADKNLKARIVNKNGTSAEWEKATSFIPKKGELILYTDLNKIKIGDGVTKVNDLPFLTVPSKTSDLTNDSDYANKKYVDDAIPTAQIEELSSAVAKAEPFFVEFTNTGTIDDPQWSANKTFSEIKSAHDTGRLCYAQVEQKNVIVPLIGFTEYNAKKKAIFSTSVLFSSHLNTQALTITEDNLISIERFVSQSQITTTGLLKGDGDNITAAVAGTDYAAANHTHDTYTATEIDTMWNAVTIS